LGRGKRKGGDDKSDPEEKEGSTDEREGNQEKNRHLVFIKFLTLGKEKVTPKPATLITRRGEERDTKE